MGRPGMSYLEAIITTKQAYRATEDERITDEYALDSLYVAMFDLVDNPDMFEAAKLPINFYETTRFESGVYLASLGLLNCNEEVTVKCEGEFSDGYWQDVGKCVAINGVAVLHSYVRDYNRDLDANLLLSAANMCLTA